MTVLRSSLLACVSLALLLPGGTGGSAMAMERDGEANLFRGGVVMELCRVGFDAAMAEAGKTPPAGMADWTCSCFLTEVRDGQSLAGAERHCRSLASRRYSL
ncbi:hypothetical protein EVJ50_01720 [Synechococcus sp. RSCCF101]|uniref:hypothetical protein n=1 Tax=Synechococcus sp. RSCCF101 TaxID=2511069 RepID=UPI001244C930|nr:hypothetical protein [Synechococcus sp. RSCCF101]QEY31157.1 hypothetical protein EVJ50_01720 [Synechococcus sp. RSCCF101]